MSQSEDANGDPAVTREVDDLIPDGRGTWTFDAAVAESFEAHLQRSIPNYENMRRFVTEAAVYAVLHARQSPLVVDLGASRGSALAPIVDRLGVQCRYVAVEISAPMLRALEERFASLAGAGGRMVIQEHDLRGGYPVQRQSATVVLSVLTLQFLPIEYRQQLLREVYDNLQPGGILILVEKVLGASAELQRLIVDIYHADKIDRGGYTKEAVDRKRLSLEGVLVPLTARFNEDLVLAAGFDAVDCCLAWAGFRGFLCLKR